MATPIESVSSLILRLKTMMLSALRALSSQEEPIATIPEKVQSFLTSPQKVLLWITEMQQQSDIQHPLKQLTCQLWASKEHTLPLFIELDQLARPLSHLFTESLQHYGLTESEAQEVIATRPAIILILLHYEKLNFKKPKNLYLTNQLEQYPIKKMIITCEAGYLVPYQNNYALNFMSYRERQAESKLFMEIKSTTPVAELEQQKVISEEYWRKLLTDDLASLFSDVIPSLDAFKRHPLNQRRIVDYTAELVARADIIRDERTHEGKGAAFQFKKLFFLFLRFSKQDEEVAIGAANAITILNFARVSFSGMDLSYIRVPSANLACSILDHALLTHADLSNVNFYQAFLRKSDLQSSMLTNTNFGETLYVFENEPKTNISSICFSPDGRYLAVGSDNITLWDQEVKQVLNTMFIPNSGTYCLCFSQDSRYLFSGTHHSLCLWEPLTGKLLNELQVEGGSVNSICFYQAMVVISVGYFQPKLYFYEFNKDQICRIKHIVAMKTDGGIYHLCVNQQGKYLALSHNNTILVFKLEGEKLVRTFFLSSQPNNVVAMDFGLANQLAYISDNKIYVIDIESKLQLRIIETQAHHFQMMYISFSHDGKLIAVAGGNSRIIKIWDTNNADLQEVDLETDGFLSKIIFSLDDTEIIYSKNNLICSQALKRLNFYLPYEYNQAFDLLSVSQDGYFIITINPNSKLASLRNYNGVLLKQFTINFINFTNRVVLSPHAKYLAVIDKAVVRIVNIFDYDRLICCEFRKHSNDVKSLIFSLDGELIASTDGNIIYVWETKNAVIKKILSGHEGYIIETNFSPNNQFLASVGTDKIVRIWNLESGKLDATFVGHSGNILCVKFSPNGEYLATAGDDKIICIWDLIERTLIMQLRGHNSNIVSLSFSEDNRTLLSGSYDKTLRLWDMICP